MKSFAHWALAATFCFGMTLSGCGDSTTESTPDQQEKPVKPEKMVRAEPKISASAALEDPESPESLVKLAIENLFDYCQDGKYEKASTLMIYQGENADQNWEEPFNYAIEEDAQAVEKTCARIQAMLFRSQKIHFREFIREREAEGEWHVWLMDVTYEDGAVESHSMAFLPYAEKKYGLGDID